MAGHRRSAGSRTAGRRAGGQPDAAAGDSTPYIVCRFCGHQNPPGGDACENCGAEFSEGTPEPPDGFEGRLLGARLRSLVASEPVWLDADATALTAVERMKAERVDHVLVGDGRHLEGIFTDRDAMLGLPGRPGPVPLAELMTPNPVVLHPDDPVARAIHEMAVGGFRHVALVDESGVRGVVTAPEVFRHLAGRLEDRRAGTTGNSTSRRSTDGGRASPAVEAARKVPRSTRGARPSASPKPPD